MIPLALGTLQMAQNTVLHADQLHPIVDRQPRLVRMWAGEPMSMKDTFLELSPEHGGLRFGPFKGLEIRLGSLPDPQNDITLPEELGILPEHVKIISQGDGSFVVAPVERSASVFIWRSGGNPKQIVTPVAIQSADDVFSADAFSVGSVEGPKFFVLQIQKAKPKAAENDPFKKAKGRLSSKSMIAEIKRQGMTGFVTTKGGAWFQYWWTFIRTGTIFQPRYIIMGFLILSGYLATGGMGLLSCKFKADQWQADAKIASAEESLQLCRGGAKSNERTFVTEAARIMGGSPTDPTSQEQRTLWLNTLSWNPTFRKAFQKHFMNIYTSPNEYSVYYNTRKSDNPVAKFRKGLNSAGMDSRLSRTLAFMAATDQNASKTEFSIGQDSKGDEACLRGPLRMTWRQAFNLKMNSDLLPADAVATSTDIKELIDNKEEGCKVLRTRVNTLNGINPGGFAESCEAEDLMRQYAGLNNKECLLTPGPDSRSVAKMDDQGQPTDAQDWKALAVSTYKQMKGGKFPAQRANQDALARLLWFYMADAINSTKFFNTLGSHFERNAQKTGSGFENVLEKVEGIEGTAPWAIDKAARVVAMSVAVPCMAVKIARVDKGVKVDELAENMGIKEEELPNWLDCVTALALAEADE
jgi:hypothetical protein